MADLNKILYKNLAIKGKEFSDNLHEWNIDTVQNWLSKGYPYLTILMAINLKWSGHAKNQDAFLDVALPWMESFDSMDPQIIDDWKQYLGGAALEKAMYGLRTMKNALIDKTPDFRTCDTKQLVKFQEYALRKTLRLIEKGEVSGVGAWLFLGLFKILLSIETRLWDAPNIDAIYLPSGREVVKGIYRLRSEAPSASKFNVNWLSDSEPGLAGGYGTEALIHDECKNIANKVDTLAMHINSGLYLYGRKEIDL